MDVVHHKFAFSKFTHNARLGSTSNWRWLPIVDPSNTFGGFENQPGYSYVVVHGDEPAWYDAKNVPHGAVTRHIYRSDVLDGEREIYVYTPPGHDSTKKYPVLYLLGGSGEV